MIADVKRQERQTPQERSLGSRCSGPVRHERLAQVSGEQPATEGTTSFVPCMSRLRALPTDWIWPRIRAVTSKLMQRRVSLSGADSGVRGW